MRVSDKLALIFFCILIQFLSKRMVQMGKKLKQIRLDRGYMQKYVSQKLGISNSYLCKIESCKVEPTAEILSKLYKLYKIA